MRVRGEASRKACTSRSSSMSSTRIASAAETESSIASSDSCIFPRPVANHSNVTPATIATERRWSTLGFLPWGDSQWLTALR